MRAKPKPPSQAERLRALLDDGRWHDTVEIIERVYGVDKKGICRLSARWQEVKRALPPGWTAERESLKSNRALSRYRLVPPAKPLDLFSTAMLLLVMPWWWV